MEYSQNSYFSDIGSTIYSSNNSVHNIENGTVQYSGYKNKIPVKKTQLGKCYSYLPVIALISIVLFFYSITLIYHLIPLFSETSEIYENQCVYESIIYHFLFALFLINYILCLFIKPGTIPDDTKWNIDQSPNFNLHEKKKNGAPRQCRWCNKFKPDRAHHCERCGTCILKMDHHCPWISRCVGWNNYKYFFLTIFYGMLTLLYTVYIITPTSAKLFRNRAPFQDVSLVFVVNVFAVVVSLVLMLFFNFHLWLIMRNKTTLEYLEGNGNKTSWDIGFYRNLSSVLGSNPIMWFLPLRVNDGQSDGLAFETLKKYNDFYDEPDFDNTTDMNSNDTMDDINPEFIITSRQNEIFKPIID